MVKTLFIFEFVDEVERFLLQCGLQDLKDADNAVLAIEPCAQIRLGKMGVNHSNTLPFFNKRGHEQALSASKRAMKRIEACLDLRDRNGYRKSYENAFFYHIRFFLHHLLFLIEVIDQAVVRLMPSRITTAGSISNHCCIIEKPLEKRFLSDAVKRYCQSNHIVHCNLKDSQRLRTEMMNRIVESVKDTIRLPIFFSMLTAIKAKARTRKIIIAPDRSFGMAHLMKTIQDEIKSALPIYLGSRDVLADVRGTIQSNGDLTLFAIPNTLFPMSDDGFDQLMDASIANLEHALASHPDDFNYKNVDLRSPLTSFARQAIRPRLRRLNARNHWLRYAVDRLQPKLVLAQHSVELSAHLGELCVKRRIPGMLISHGSHTPVQNELASVESKALARGLISSTYPMVALQTPWAKRYVEKNPTPSRAIVTGPLLFGTGIQSANRSSAGTALRKRLGIDSGKFVVLHAGTPKTTYMGLRFFTYETVDEYIANMATLIVAAEKMGNCHVIVRYRPLRNLSKEGLRDLLPKSSVFSIHTEGQFVDFLMMADLLVSYASTTIEEALLNLVPVLLFDPHGKYRHIQDAQVLDPSVQPQVDSCYYCGNADNLKWALAFVRHHHLETKAPASLWARHRFDPPPEVSLSAFLS